MLKHTVQLMQVQKILKKLSSRSCVIWQLYIEDIDIINICVFPHFIFIFERYPSNKWLKL